jgi:hypothetical protein
MPIPKDQLQRLEEQLSAQERWVPTVRRKIARLVSRGHPTQERGGRAAGWLLRPARESMVAYMATAETERARYRESAHADNLRTAYEKVCECHTSMVEFRAKLLALLPLASGAGVFLLMTSEPTTEYIAAGLFGALLTIGLFIFEYRGIRFCRGLASTGIKLEKSLGLESARFKDKPDDENKWPGGHMVEWAGRVIYGSVLAAWLFVAGLGAGERW